MQDASLLRLGLGGRLLEATVPEAEAVGAQLLLDWVENALLVSSKRLPLAPAHLGQHLGAKALGVLLEAAKVLVDLLLLALGGTALSTPSSFVVRHFDSCFKVSFRFSL